jgi:16S rRNA (uracil1498-N3)-methyltransferase
MPHPPPFHRKQVYPALPRFFPQSIDTRHALIQGEDARHIAQVLRLRPGDRLTLCDGQGSDYQARILSLSPQEVSLELLSQSPSRSEPSLRLHLYQCCPKGDKLEWIIQKCVELGAFSITPVLSRFCVSRPDPKSAAKKGERYQKIALSAAKQSGRGLVPAVHPQIPLEQALRELSALPCSLFFYEQASLPLRQVLEKAPSSGDIGLLIGSEGGFSPEEAAQAAAAGLHTVSLGPRILRCETAPLAACTAILYATGNLE